MNIYALFRYENLYFYIIIFQIFVDIVSQKLRIDSKKFEKLMKRICLENTVIYIN